jgi:hypothetical protein
MKGIVKVLVKDKGWPWQRRWKVGDEAIILKDYRDHVPEDCDPPMFRYRVQFTTGNYAGERMMFRETEVA